MYCGFLLTVKKGQKLMMTPGYMVWVVLLFSVFSGGSFAQQASRTVGRGELVALREDEQVRSLPIPLRSEGALEGGPFARHVSGLSIADREKEIVRAVLAGNVPAFSRNLYPIQLTETVAGKRYEVTFFATYDYLAIGSEKDYFYVPMTPYTAQYLADEMACVLPTAKMVDVIYAHGEMPLNPQPIAPSDKMTTIPVFLAHTDSIQQQLRARGIDRGACKVMVGHKKDIVISNKIYSGENGSQRVVIYGWHLREDNPIQPLYNGHIASYADYSHGVRFISQSVLVNGEVFRLDDVLRDSTLSRVFSREGVISEPYYPKKK